MTRITWDRDASRFFELGVDRGVLFSPGLVGVAWSGLVSVKTSIAGGESTAKYQDGIKLAVRIAGDEFTGSIDAFTYPDEFAEHDGTLEIYDGLFVTQQVRKPFNFAYRTLIGSDTLGIEAGYKLHILYSIVAKPSNRDHNTINEGETPQTLSWAIEGVPVRVPGYKPSTHLILDSRYVPVDIMTQIEDILYGTSSRAPRLPSPQEIMSLFGDSSDLILTDLGDGIFTAEGPTVTIRNLESFTIDHPSLTDNGDGTVTIEYEPV